MRNKRPQRKPCEKLIHIRELIPEALKTCRVQRDQGMQGVWDVWNATVGDRIARNAQPAAFKGSLLIVNVSSPVWIQELQFQKNEILTRLNEALGCEQIKEISFKSGPV